jgi:LAO/AO transport system kinase
MAAPDAATLAAALRGGDRRALARAITLVESTRDDHRARAETLLERVLGETGRATRIGISGPPGAGKSTFIEAFGLHLLELGHKPAVLAVDPSSPVSGGSILGDKTRMERLARDERAFIRPSPTGGTLGGIARRTREASLLCEAAGFDVVVIETVGVGQSETAVADMVDMFMLIVPPAGGDELQGIKKGIVELADLLVVNKFDGDLAKAAGRAVSDYAAAVHLLGRNTAGWMPPVLAVSSLENRGIDQVWSAIRRHRDTLGADKIREKRAAQAHAWMWSEIEAGLIAALRSDDLAEARLRKLESQVTAGTVTPLKAARDILAAFLREKPAR